MKSAAEDNSHNQAAEEIFELTKLSWLARTRQTRAKGQIELTEFEFLTLDWLCKYDPDPLTVGDIQKRIHVLPAQMSRVIRSLEAKSAKPLIRCQINSQDKRKVDVLITEAGRKAHDAFREERLVSSRLILSKLSQDDRCEFMRIMKEIRKIMSNQLTDKELSKEGGKVEKMISSS